MLSGASSPSRSRSPRRPSRAPSSTTYSYDNFDSATGLVFTHITDPNAKLTKLGYDEHGRLLKSIDAAGNTTSYAYTANVLTSITDANDNVTQLPLRPAQAPRQDDLPRPEGPRRYTYYADGLLKTKTDRMGQTITYEYDASKRLKRKIYPNPAQTITYTYEGQKLTQVDDTVREPGRNPHVRLRLELPRRAATRRARAAR